jgi:type IV pilus biogenesis protein CpaD/CtpE
MKIVLSFKQWGSLTALSVELLMISFMFVASSAGLKSCRRAPKFHIGLLGDSTAARHPVHLNSAEEGGTSLCAQGVFSLHAPRNVSLEGFAI